MDKVEIIVRQLEQNDFSETVVAHFDKADTQQIDSKTMTFPGLKIFLNEHSVYRKGELIPVTSREFHTLVYLARHPGWVFTAESIYENVWQESSENIGTAVANVISQLRHKLTPDTLKDGYIQTIIGDRYKFVIPR